MYSITDKVLRSSHGEDKTGLNALPIQSSSFFGPLIVGLIADATGNIRYAFFFLVVMLSVPIPILYWRVDMARGRGDARAYFQETARPGAGVGRT